MVKELQPERRARVTALFRAFDYDGSGGIEADEFLAIGKAFRGDAEWDEKKNAEAIARVDADRDGRVDVNEFVEFFELNGMAKRPEDKFNRLMDRYMEAAIAGRKLSSPVLSQPPRADGRSFPVVSRGGSALLLLSGLTCPPDCDCRCQLHVQARRGSAGSSSH